nr:uncharacterized protein LOC124223045 [Neodiprion pinetum]
MVRCHVKGCGRSARKDKEHHFFRQPKNTELRKKWREFAKVPGSPTHLRICSDHFEPKCIRKKCPRPLLFPKSIPTILPGQSLQGNAHGVNHQQTVTFERSSLQDECSHKDNSIVTDVTKATGEDPTVIDIQTNNKIRIVIRGKECHCQR